MGYIYPTYLNKLHTLRCSVKGGAEIKSVEEFRIYGRLRKLEDGTAVQGLLVEAVDKDFKYDDRLGTVITDKDGNFEIVYTEDDFKDAYVDTKPDIYLRIKAPNGRVLHTTEDKVRYRANKTEEFIIEIPQKSIEKVEDIMAKDIEVKKETYEQRYEEEANLKKKLILDDVQQWIGKLTPEKREEPYLVIGMRTFTPNQLLEEVKKDTEIGRMVSRTLDKGRLELSKRKRRS
ncbi:MAG: hypothetical protein JXA38_00955 [Methanosarcinaceae archaeon]|nr:hypothetical protein [Methanosarcinaceae archaeon]